MNVTIPSLISAVQNILEMLVPLIIGAALVGFLYGLAMRIFKAGDKDGYKQGGQLMLWGIVTLFVMVSVWGLVGILQQMFFGDDPMHAIDPPGMPVLPTDPTPGLRDPAGR